MKYIALLSVLTFAMLSSSCKKTSNELALTYCDGLVTDTIGTNDNGRIYMPDAFTANGDGLNDIAKPHTANITSLTFSVYDHNNNVLFTTSQLNDGWHVPAGTANVDYYYYRIQALTSGGRHLGACGPLYRLSCYPKGISHSDWHFEDRLTSQGFTDSTHDVLPNCQ